MTEMEFYEGKKEDSQIHYSMMRIKTTQEGMVTHVMDICQFRKKSIEVANENDHRRSLNFGASASEYHIIENIQIECFEGEFYAKARFPYRPGQWEPVD